MAGEIENGTDPSGFIREVDGIHCSTFLVILNMSCTSSSTSETERLIMSLYPSCAKPFRRFRISLRAKISALSIIPNLTNLGVQNLNVLSAVLQAFQKAFSELGSLALIVTVHSSSEGEHHRLKGYSIEPDSK
jgi:hypothetical protein